MTLRRTLLTMSTPFFLCVGLTPTLQRTMRFSELTLGEVNRAWEVLTTASGKAVNVARVLHTLGASVCLAHPLGGSSGRYLASQLPFTQEILWSKSDTPTRTCTTLLTPSGLTTELVEEAAPLPIAEQEALLAQVGGLLSGAHALVLSGSLPPGAPPELYARLVRAATVQGVPTFLDAQKEPLRLALAERPYLAKPNRQETIAALHLPPQTDALTCAHALREAGAQNALVSEGQAGAVLLTDQGAWHILPPIVAALNPIGAGDSLLGGLVFKGVGGPAHLLEAACFGTACAAANCLTLTSGTLQPDDVTRLLPQVSQVRVQ